GEFHEVPEPLFYRRVHPASSRAGDRSAAEVAAWFDPAREHGDRVPPLLRVWGSTIRGLATAGDVPAAERAVCVGVYAEAWLEKRARARLGRVRRDRRRTRPTHERSPHPGG